MRLVYAISTQAAAFFYYEPQYSEWLMSQKLVTKNGKRFVLYISPELREEITARVDKDGTTLADFARDAFESYLKEKRLQERQAALAETCHLYNSLQHQLPAQLDLNSWPK